MKFEIFLGQLTVFIEFIQNISVQVLIQGDKLDFSKSNRNIQKVLFVWDLYEYLEILEGKIRDGIFFCVNKAGNYSVRRFASS